MMAPSAGKTFILYLEFLCYIYYRTGLLRLLPLAGRKARFSDQNYADIITPNYWNIKVEF
jgi:hypothetical protein